MISDAGVLFMNTSAYRREILSNKMLKKSREHMCKRKTRVALFERETIIIHIQVNRWLVIKNRQFNISNMHWSAT